MNAVAKGAASVPASAACPFLGHLSLFHLPKIQKYTHTLRRRLTLLPCTPVSLRLSSQSLAQPPPNSAPAPPHPPPLLQLQGVAACFLVHFTCPLFSDAMRLQKPACYVLKLVCNIFVSPTTTTAAAVEERKRERVRYACCFFFPISLSCLFLKR